MNTALHLDDAGYALIARWEGKKNVSYLDSARIPTIGIGFIRYTLGDKAGQRVRLGESMTDEQIRFEFANQVKTYEDAVKAAVKVPLTQSQFNACVSLCYNIGATAFANSTVVRRLNEQRYRAACEAFSLWNKAGGRVVQGLANRRAAEQKEFFRNG